MRLQTKLDALKNQIESSIPSDALKIVHQATDGLRHSVIIDYISYKVWD